MSGISITRIQFISRTLTALLVILLGWQLAWWTWHFITPSLRNNSVASASTAAPDVLIGRQLFGDAGPASNVVTNTAPQTGIRLKGVFAVDGAPLSAAVLNTGGRDLAVRLGQEFVAGATLAEVHADFVVVSRSGIRERIELDKYDARTSKPTSAATAPAAQFRLNVASTGTNAYALSRQELNSVLQDPRQQVFFNGRISAAASGGVRVDDVPSGSLLDKIGLKTGDIITGINGQPVNSQGDLVRLYTQFGSLTSIRAEVRRGGAPVVLSYAIQN